MKRIFSYALLMSLFLYACQTKTENSQESENEEDILEIKPTVSLEKIWETDTLLITNESLVYDAVNQVFYVSCIGGDQPWENDGKGFIAKIDTGGLVIELQWVTGLNGPKGLGLVGNTLYANDNSQLVSIDITSGTVINKLTVADAQSLNDIAVGSENELYISDTNTSTIYRFMNDEIEMFYQDTLIGGLNGIWADEDRLVLAGFQSGKVFTLSLDSKELKEVADGMNQADGVEKIDNDYFISCWGGEIYHLGENWEKSKVLDTKDLSINSADIEIIPAKSLLLVPTFFDNRVMAYEISK